jgi:hypothetical protein
MSHIAFNKPASKVTAKKQKKCMMHYMASATLIQVASTVHKLQPNIYVLQNNEQYQKIASHTR